MAVFPAYHSGLSEAHNKVQEEIFKKNEKKRELFETMFQRLLTDEELIEAVKYGMELNCYFNEWYNAAEKQEEMARAFFQQAKFRTLKAIEDKLSIKDLDSM